MMARAIRTIQIGLVSLLLVLFCFTGTAHARGGCFGSGTPILTSEGYKPIENLSITDHLVGLNLSNGRTEVEDIGEIQVAQASDYYLINDTTQVTGSHPFYVQKADVLELTEVHNLKKGDHLIGENNTQIEISSIQHIKASLTIYNLINITPAHNFYANGILVHNKGGGGGSGGGSGGSAYGGAGTVTLNKKTVPGFMLSLLLLVLGSIPFAFLREIYNAIRFKNTLFTEDSDLIEFTTNINENFANAYSVRYAQDDEPWIKIRPSQEIAATEYQHFISRAELIDAAYQLFIKYQNDWAEKNFEGMLEYIDQPFYESQKKIFLNDFGDNFDIVYQPKLDAVVPLSCHQQGENYIFKFQINAELINFSLSPKGYVLSGEAYPRSFTEYWKIRIDSAKRCYLMDIDKLYEFSNVTD
ncbi:MAG: hypothetical protein F6K42_05310 [Leptolyngbya sp. SIO1D8]|nr:hypothetical protein [Leptolyngbya sp. SIO1D8]